MIPTGGQDYFMGIVHAHALVIIRMSLEINGRKDAMELEQWSKRTVGMGETRIGRDNPRGTGYPQDRTFGLDVTWTLRIYLTSNESVKLKPEEIMDKRFLLTSHRS